MNNTDFSIALLVDQTPREAFNAISNVRGWWIDDIEGHTEKLDDEFAVRFEDIHYSKQRLVEVVPDARIVWLVTDSHLSFLHHKSEWTGTRISFEISKKGNQTQVRFRHEGLAPEVECYGDCSSAWSEYIRNSLQRLITTGKGEPFRAKSKAKAS